MQIMTSPAFGEKHPLYIAKWHGHTRRSFLSWFRREEGWSVTGHHQPAQPCKVAGNPLDAMAPSNPAAPVPLWWHYLSKAWQLRWRKMYFDHWVPRPWWRSPPPDHRCPGGQQRYCTNPGHCWFKRMSHGSSESHVTSSRIAKKQATLKRFQGSFMRFVVKSTDTFSVNFLQDVLRRKALKPRLVCKQP